MEFVTPLSIVDLGGNAGICNPKDSLIDLGEKEDIYEPVCGISYTHEAKDFNNKYIACYHEDISLYRNGWCNWMGINQGVLGSLKWVDKEIKNNSTLFRFILILVLL